MNNYSHIFQFSVDYPMIFDTKHALLCKLYDLRTAIVLVSPPRRGFCASPDSMCLAIITNAT